MLSIIIINYNTFDLTVNCIESIKKETIIDYEIILIDNASKNCNPKDFEKIFPEIKLLELTENVGFGRANNIGMKEAKGDYFLLLNSDTIIKEKALDECYNYLKTNEEIDILGCRAEFENGQTQMTVFPYEGEQSLIRSIIYFIKRNSTLQYFNTLLKNKRNKETKFSIENEEIVEQVPNYIQNRKIGSLSGAFIMLKKKIFKETGGFDPDFFMYYEETEWFINRIIGKYNILYYPKASIIHLCGRSDVYGVMNTQFWLSSFLFWYKISIWHFLFYTLFIIIDIPCCWLNYLLSQNKSYISKSKQLRTSLKYFFNILKYKNIFNGRKGMLKIMYKEK